MTTKKILGRLALAACLLMVAVGTAPAQIAATISDTGGFAPPVPGAYDQYMTNLALFQNKPGNGNLNYYDNSATPPAMTFTTGSNPGGYILNAVSFQTGGTGSAAGAGGFQDSQAYRLRIYSLSGGNAYGQPTPTNATLLAYYLTQSFQMLNYSNWLQVSGLNLALAPNAIYAYSFQRSGNGYMNMGNVAGNPYAGGEVCLIQAAGGTNAVSYGSSGITGATNYDAVFDIGLALPSALTVNPPTASQANPVTAGATVTLSCGTVAGNAGTVTYQWQMDGGSGGVLTNIPGATSATLSVNTTGFLLGKNIQYDVVVNDPSAPATITSATLALQVRTTMAGTLVDTGTATAPSAGSYDAYQLSVNTGGVVAPAGMNYNSWASSGGGNSPGQTFTTGNNAKGYSMSSVSLVIGTGVNAALTAALAVNTNNFHLYLYSISPDGLTATVMADITNAPAGFALAWGDWLKWSFPSITLTPNTVYAYAIKNFTGNSSPVATSSGTADAYAGGQIATIPAAGGAVYYGSSGFVPNNNDAAFDVGLIPNGVNVIVTVPSATPNPAYALSPVKLAATATTPGVFTYKWLTDDGSGAVPPNYSVIPGAASTNLTVVPPDLNPGGADYTTNFYFVANNTLSGDSATSSVVTLTIHAASAPQFTTTPGPASLVAFAGGSITYAATEIGTLPITNQWLFDNGGGYAGLPGKTNTTLALVNLQTTNSGNYQLGASNVVGGTSAAVTLTVLPAPAAPLASQKYAYNVYTNNPWAYWRLNETNDPTTANGTNYMAYDYSAHGFNSIYGNAVTVNNPGPQPPAFPGMDANELAVGTTVSTPNAYLTVPPLNLAGNSNVTFMAWINPNGPQSAGAGLLINRGGPDGACGFGFGGVQDNLGYVWNNNSAATYNWPSGLAVAENQWNFVAYVITPTNATVYLGNLNGGTTNFLQANNPIAHTAETFAGGTIFLGADPKNINNNFNGLITEAALFTNAMTSTQVQQYFLVGIGGQALAPTVTSATAYPAATVYSGQNVQLSANASGSAPLILNWQASPDASTWTSIPGATASTLLVNPLVVGTVYYQLVATNAAGSGSSGAIGVTFNPLPPTPAGLWTANFQITNNLLGGNISGAGTGPYVGRGILGGGNYWNILPCVVTTLYASQTLTNASDFMDDGINHSGISCFVYNASGHSSSVASSASVSDIGNLLNQYVLIYYSPNALQFQNVPPGTYNLALYGIDGTYQDRGTTFVVHGADGNQTNSTLNAAPSSPLAEGLNFATFTSVHVTGGTLNIDVNPNPDGHGGGNTEADLNGVQLQLVSYDAPAAAFSAAPTNPFVSQAVVFTNTTVGAITNSIWDFGDGSSVTNNSNASVSHSYAGTGTYTISLTVTGPGGGPSTATRTGYIVVAGNPTTPTISNVKLSGGQFILSGANGLAGAQYRILTSTNLALPLAGWTPVATNFFAPDGSYSYTNSSVTNAAAFFRVVTP